MASIVWRIESGEIDSFRVSSRVTTRIRSLEDSGISGDSDLGI